MIARITLPLAMAVALSGCVVAEVVTAPIDAVTTTQSEADEDRGKAIRQREERIEDLQKKLAEAQEDCDGGDSEACAEAASIQSEIQALKDTPAR
ncbi:MAG: hypothetical protein AAGB23_09215 [Pseudomonadota bacterium]